MYSNGCRSSRCCKNIFLSVRKAKNNHIEVTRIRRHFLTTTKTTRTKTAKGISSYENENMVDKKKHRDVFPGNNNPIRRIFTQKKDIITASSSLFTILPLLSSSSSSLSSSSLSSSSSLALYSSSSTTSNSSITSTSTSNVSSSSTYGHLASIYMSMADAKDVQYDPIQFHGLHSLERLREEMLSYEPPAVQTTIQKPPSSLATEEFSFFGDLLFGSSSSSAATTTTTTTTASYDDKNGAPKGVYTHGGVGCGKTFLMNIFYESIDFEPWVSDKQQIHFHKFMLRVHQHMHQARYNNDSETPRSNLAVAEADSILPFAIQETIKEGRLICFDEFQVTDVADALILQRLFEGLWENGCIIVATSNRPPSDLYLNGIQRDRFLPFVGRLQNQCEVVSMDDENIVDYRMLQGKNKTKEDVYFVGKKKSSQYKQFLKLFYQLTEGRSVAPAVLRITPEQIQERRQQQQSSTQQSQLQSQPQSKSQPITSTTIATTFTTNNSSSSSNDKKGRKVRIEYACLSMKLCRFTFEELCQKALGAADYLIIGQTFNTVFVEQIPTLGLEHINYLRRFIIFIDTMYECQVKVVLHTLSADTSHNILTLSEEDEKNKHNIQMDEIFAFDRTISRLEEMSSEKYLRKRWVGANKQKK